MANGWMSAKEATKRRKKVLQLRARGLRMEDIAKRLGITRQRVGQIVKEEEKRSAAT